MMAVHVRAGVTAIEVPLWRTMIAAETPMSASALAAAIRAQPNSVITRLNRWEAAGLVCRRGIEPIRFALTDAARAAANDDHLIPPQVLHDGTIKPRRRSQRARLWSAMRVLKRFTLPELMIASGATRRSAEDMINCLQRAGYLRREGRGNAMRGTWSVYVLVERSGPRPPVISWRTLPGPRVRILTDPNTGAVIDISPAAATLRRSRSAAPARGEG